MHLTLTYALPKNRPISAQHLSLAHTFAFRACVQLRIARTQPNAAKRSTTQRNELETSYYEVKRRLTQRLCVLARLFEFFSNIRN